ncbi:hypothetical protein BH09ACT8_BH09ACT8_01480 [soil metagenome]
MAIDLEFRYVPSEGAARGLGDAIAQLDTGHRVATFVGEKQLL